VPGLLCVVFALWVAMLVALARLAVLNARRVQCRRLQELQHHLPVWHASPVAILVALVHQAVLCVLRVATLTLLEH